MLTVPPNYILFNHFKHKKNGEIPNFRDSANMFRPQLSDVPWRHALQKEAREIHLRLPWVADGGHGVASIASAIGNPVGLPGNKFVSHNWIPFDEFINVYKP